MIESGLTPSLILFLRREWSLMMRNRADTVQPFSFFLIVVLLFPLSLSPDNELLQVIMPGCIWVAVVLAIMLELNTLFRADYQDGSLEQWIIHYRSLPMIVVGKVLAHWLVTGLLLSILSALMCALLNIPAHEIRVLFVSLLLSTLSLQLIGAIGAALTVTLRRSGMLLAVIILPLYIPILIFGAGVVNRAAEGDSIVGPLYILAAILVLSLTLAPLAISAALRQTID